MGKGSDRSSADLHTKCGVCGTCEWNSLLAQRDRYCRCGVQLSLHRKKSKGKGGEQDTLALKLPQDRKSTPDATAVLKRAAELAKAAWRGANAKYDAAVKAVERAAEQLAQARLREEETVRTLAQAELAKRTAVKALAAEVGLTSQAPEAGSSPEKTGGDLSFDVVWDENFFASLHDGTMECEEAEKKELLQLEKDLVAAKSYLGEKGDKVREWYARMEVLRNELASRMAKKRKGADGNAKATKKTDEPAAAAPGTAPEEPAPTATETESRRASMR
ncbi:unnamed protein product, partial [Prorocentrum cordatum]